MTLHPDDITLAARAMTDIEPPSDLEARIKQRLDREAVRVAPRTTRFLWPAAGLAAAALLALLVVQGPTWPARRSLGEGGSTVQGSAEVPQSRSSDVVAVPDSRHDAGAMNPGPWTVPNPGRPVPDRQSEAELAWLSRRIPALEVIDPLAVDRLTFESIQPEAMLITPLTITPLVTSPVHGDPDAGRQHFD